MRTPPSIIAVAYLNLLTSCTAGPNPRQDMFLVDLRQYSPLTGYTLDGRVLNITLQPLNICTLFGHIRDATTAYILHDEGRHEVSPQDFSHARTVARELGGKIHAIFPMIQEVNDIRLAPSGDQVAFAGCSIRELGECQCGLVFARANGDAMQRLWCAPGKYQDQDGLSWSPDAKRIAFSFGGSVFLIDVATSQTAYLAHGNAPSWSPVGDRVALTDGDAIVIINTRTKSSETHNIGVKGIVSSGLAWSPDAAVLSLVHRAEHQPGDSRVRTVLGVVDTATWQYRDLGIYLWGEKSSVRWVNLSPRSFTVLAQIITDPCSGKPSP